MGVVHTERPVSEGVTSLGLLVSSLHHTQFIVPQVKSFSEMMDEVVKNGKRPEIPQDCPASLRKLIVQCWDGEPAKRPKFSEIIPMVTSFRYLKLLIVLIRAAVQRDYH